MEVCQCSLHSSYDKLKVSILPPSPTLLDILARSMTFFKHKAVNSLEKLFPLLDELPSLDVIDWDEMEVQLAAVKRVVQ